MSKIRLYRLLVKLFLGGLGLILLTEVVLLIVVASTSDASAAQDSAPKPAREWYVCGDLGFGSVPGVPDARQRLKLCHERGWTVYTYCTQPSIQAPPLGAICDRINADTYTCGAGFQLIQSQIAFGAGGIFGVGFAGNMIEGGQALTGLLSAIILIPIFTLHHYKHKWKVIVSRYPLNYFIIIVLLTMITFLISYYAFFGGWPQLSSFIPTELRKAAYPQLP